MNKEKAYIDLKEITEVIKDAPMKEYTSFKVGGSADLLIDPGDADQFIKAVKYLTDENIPYMVMGNGSNIIFRDGGYRGAVILTYSSTGGACLSNIKYGLSPNSDTGFDQTKQSPNSDTGLDQPKQGCNRDSIVDGDDSTVVTAEAGVLLSTLAKTVADRGELSFTGLEFASGIPGTLGGALFMNAGAYGGEMKDIVKSATVYDPATHKKEKIDVKDMDLAYRHSIFQSNGKIILDVTMKMEHGNPDHIQKTMRELLQKRNSKQPVNYPSAGSFFKRPEGYFAGKLIEDSGLRGLKKGGAQISEKHAGFMINTGNATFQDIEDLMQLVKTKVYDKFGVMLEPEVRIVGE